MSDTAIDLVDSHCHLDRLNLDAYEGDFQAMMAATRADGISHMLCIGVDLETFPRVRELAERHDDVHATVGVHPCTRIPVSRTPTNWCAWRITPGGGDR